MPLSENHKSHHICAPSFKKIGHLHSACEKICWLVRVDLASGLDERRGGKWTCEEDCERGR